MFILSLSLFGVSNTLQTIIFSVFSLLPWKIIAILRQDISCRNSTNQQNCKVVLHCQTINVQLKATERFWNSKSVLFQMSWFQKSSNKLIVSAKMILNWGKKGSKVASIPLVSNFSIEAWIIFPINHWNR